MAKKHKVVKFSCETEKQADRAILGNKQTNGNAVLNTFKDLGQT